VRGAENKAVGPLFFIDDVPKISDNSTNIHSTGQCYWLTLILRFGLGKLLLLTSHSPSASEEEGKKYQKSPNASKKVFN
jgi:hypothetical protein